MSTRREYEQKVVGIMVGMYCRGNHGSDAVASDGLCDDCASLLAYAQRHAARCRYGDGKTFCANCPTPCYAPKMRERIREVMRYAGPRMMFFHPVIAVRHLARSRKEKRALRSRAE